MISTSTRQAAAIAAAVALLLLLLRAGAGLLLGGLSCPARRYESLLHSHWWSGGEGVGGFGDGRALPGIVTEVMSHAGSVIAGMATDQSGHKGSSAAALTEITAQLQTQNSIDLKSPDMTT